MAKNTFVTDVGTAFWPKLAEKDRDYQNFNTGLLLDENGKAKFLKALDEFTKDIPFKTKKPKLPGEDTENGFLIRAKSDYQPLIFDSKNKKLYDSRDNEPEECPRIGGGTKMRMLLQFNHYTKNGEGVNLYLKQVQIIDLVEYGGGSAFDEYAGGYEGDEGSSDRGFGGSDESSDEPDEALDI